VWHNSIIDNRQQKTLSRFFLAKKRNKNYIRPSGPQTQKIWFFVGLLISLFIPKVEEEEEERRKKTRR